MKIEVMEPYEKNMIDLVSISNINPAYAAVSILIFSRNYHRPQNELAELLMRIMPSLTVPEITDAISWMKEQGLIIEKFVQNHYSVLEIVDKFPEKMEAIIQLDHIAEKLYQISSEKHEKVHVRYLGRVSENSNYETFISLIRDARSTIKYPMLNSAPYPLLVETLKKVAERGVKVQILLGEDIIVKKYKGTTKKSRLEEWKSIFSDTPNVDIKGFLDESVTDLCTSILIDEKNLRFVIYDPEAVTSLDGKLLEVFNLSGQDINLIRWFNNRFNKAWNEAASDAKERRLKKIFSLFTFAIMSFVVSATYLFCFYGENPIFDQVDLLIISPSGLYIFKALWENGKSYYSRFKAALKSIRRE